jgi:hypothetical protein
MHNRCPPKTEDTPAAIADDRKTSTTPYFPVVSTRSKENAIPGRTLKQITLTLPLGREITVLGGENERSCWNHSVVPGVSPVSGVVRDLGANIVPNSSPKFEDIQ